MLPLLLRRLGFQFYVSMASTVNLITGRRFRTPWNGYMGAGMLQERLVRFGGGIASRISRRGQVVKVFLHPQRAMESGDCARVIQLIARLARELRLETYGSIVGA
jgi:hypothetical protein